MASMSFTIADNLMVLKDLVNGDFASSILINDLVNYVDGISKRLNDGVSRTFDELISIYRNDMIDYVFRAGKNLDLDEKQIDVLLEIVDEALDID